MGTAGRAVGTSRAMEVSGSMVRTQVWDWPLNEFYRFAFAYNFAYLGIVLRFLSLYGMNEWPADLLFSSDVSICSKRKRNTYMIAFKPIDLEW